MGEGDRPHRASKDARLSTGYEDGGGGRAATGLDSYDCPENLAQRLEKVQSAPGIASAAMAGVDAGPSIANVAARWSRPRAATDCVARPPEGQGFPAAGSSGDSRPENPPQRLENVESAPGIASAATAGVDAGPSIANVAARWSRPRAATDCVARPPEGQGFPAAGSSGDSRPENPPQRLENVESAPGIASAAMAGAGAGPSIANAAAHGSRPRAATDCVARPPQGLGFPAAGSSGDARPKIRRNALKRLNPRPELRQPRWPARTPASQSRTPPPAGPGL